MNNVRTNAAWSHSFVVMNRFLLSECTTSSCSGHIIQADSGSLPLLGFNRSFTWNIKASLPNAFKIDFTKLGLQQIGPSGRCPDKHTYTLKALQTTGSVAVGKYCKTGTVTNAQILNQGSFSLDVPAGQELQNGQFNVSVGEEIKCKFNFLHPCNCSRLCLCESQVNLSFSLSALAKISVTFPKGTSSSELLSANYPDSFPDDDVMEWRFQIPEKHKAAVKFLTLTEPRCLKKETAVEYHRREIGALVLRLTDAQPSQIQRNFSLTLRNCEMDRSRAGSPGLSLSLKVSVNPLGLYIIHIYYTVWI